MEKQSQFAKTQDNRRKTQGKEVEKTNPIPNYRKQLAPKGKVENRRRKTEDRRRK